MTTSQNFNGLTMPVFTAFGWAGQEAAVNFALEQLELFIRSLHASLPRAVQTVFPFAGINKEDKSVYLAASEDVDSDIHITFVTRPMSLELVLALTEKQMIAKALKYAEKQPVIAHRYITELGSDWSFHVQQMEVDEDSGEAMHYQDLFKDSVVNLSDDLSQEVLSKAAYLNGEDKWVTPLYLSSRYSAEKISVMGTAVLDVMSQEITKLMPLIYFLTGRKAKKATKSKSRTKSKKSATASASPVAATKIVEIDPEEGFTYTTNIKPLFLRKGFVNLTPQHWDFFAINSRTETRDVTVYYDGVYDKNSTVWHIQSNGIARLVLSPTVHHWFEDNFEEGDEIQLSATRIDNDEIQVSLKPTN